MHERNRRLLPQVFALLLFGCMSSQAASASADAAPVSAGAQLPDVILISLDTTRADHLSLYGYPLPTSPNLARFADRAVVFQKARTVVPLTGPSHASLFTSLYPHQHGLFRNGIPIREDIPTLAGMLAQQGYDTAAFVSGWTLKRKICGLDSGFRVYDEGFTQRYKFLNQERPAEEVTRAVADFLASGSYRRPLFLFIHYFDPHAPYRRHSVQWEELFDAAARIGWDIDKEVLAYDNEVAYMDHHLGSLLEILGSQGLMSNAIVWILGDHGESLGEHDYWGHGRRVYEQTLHVPMVLYAPGKMPDHAEIGELASTLDVLPTTLGLLGISPPPGHPLEGRDQSGYLASGKPLPAGRQYFETFKGTWRKFTRIIAPEVPDEPSLLGYYEGHIKYILESDSNHIEIYDISVDNSETENLASPMGSDFSDAELLSWFQKGRSLESVTVDLSTEDVNQLKSLGYIN